MANRRTLTLLMACSVTLLDLPQARANFVDDRLDARGFCSADGPGGPGSMPKMYGVDKDAPFGKAATDWTQADLDHLKAAFDRCRSIARRLGARYDQLSYDDLVTRIPQWVAEANFKNARKAEVAAAAQRSQVFQDQQRAAALEKERAAAIVDQQAAEKDRASAQQASAATIARDQALIAAAHARRDATLAKEKAAAADAEAKAAETEADDAEHAKPAVAAPSASAAKPAPSVPEYRDTTVTDIQVDGAQMAGEKVVVRGYVSVFSDNGATIYQHEDDMNGINLRLDDADPAKRRYIIEQCGRTTRTCRLVVRGTIVLTEEGRPELDVD